MSVTSSYHKEMHIQQPTVIYQLKRATVKWDVKFTDCTQLKNIMANAPLIINMIVAMELKDAYSLEGKL